MKHDRQIGYVMQRQRRMAEMIESTERKLLGLYREAARYRMKDLLSDRSLVNECLEREVVMARLEGDILQAARDAG